MAGNRSRRTRRQELAEGGPRPGDELRLTLGPMTNRGVSLAHTAEGQAVFVSFGVPGEHLVAVVDRVHKDHLQAHVVEVIEASRDRVQPLCPYFGACGGCNFQHIAYERQLELKRDVVVETLQRIGKFEGVRVLATVPSPSPWFYRNQARFSTNRWGDVGFTRRMSNQVLRTDICYILEPGIRDLMPLLQGKGSGLHQIVVRAGVNTGELLVAPDLADRGVVVPTGQASLRESVGGATFVISPSAFFQVNTAQAANLARIVAARLALQPDDVLADLYAGGGFFSALLAGACRSVFAIEVSRQAAEDAARNLAEFENVCCVQAEVEAALPGLPEPPTKILLDPSREGCAPAALRAMLAARPQRIVYVSCDAATLARDLRVLVDGGYALLDVQPLDMFPQTFHVECIATLEPAALA